MSPASTTTIIGNLTRDPEIRYTREGQATTSLGVAVNRRWQNRETNEWEESTSFFDVVTWRDLAENVALSLTKGMRVVVTGRLEQRSWETEEGDRRFKVEIVADEVGASLRFATVDVHKVERHRGIDADPGVANGTPATEDEAVGRRLTPTRFPASVRLTKGEVFSACQALADADRCLVRTGRLGEADALGDLFLLFEERLVTGVPTRRGPTRGPGRPLQSSVGSYSMDSEFTQ